MQIKPGTIVEARDIGDKSWYEVEFLKYDEHLVYGKYACLAWSHDGKHLECFDEIRLLNKENKEEKEVNNMMKSFIVVNTEQEFIHRYKDAPKEVAFLRDYHRHTLKISVEIEVSHDDRELEFIMVKDYINSLFVTKIGLYKVDKSCEMVCKELIEILHQKYGIRDITAIASEDGEFAGKVVYTKEGK